MFAAKLAGWSIALTVSFRRIWQARTVQRAAISALIVTL
jgi:hypothetical protein